MRTTSGLILKGLRGGANLSQADLASKTGIARSTISELESDKYAIAPDKLDKFASVLSQFVDIAYVAGLFDRKSAIGVLEMKKDYLNRGQNRSSQNSLMVARVEFRTKHLILAETIKRVMGVGSVSKLKNYSNPGTFYYTYMAWHKSGEVVIEKLLPYIRLKRPQCQLILELRDMQNSNYAGGGKGRGQGSPLTLEQVKRMEEIRQEVKSLNKRL